MRVPKYSHHKPTGQAYVRLNGKFLYLGKYGSDESHRRYEATIGTWLDMTINKHESQLHISA